MSLALKALVHERADRLALRGEGEHLAHVVADRQATPSRCTLNVTLLLLGDPYQQRLVLCSCHVILW